MEMGTADGSERLNIDVIRLLIKAAHALPNKLKAQAHLLCHALLFRNCVCFGLVFISGDLNLTHHIFRWELNNDFIITYTRLIQTVWSSVSTMWTHYVDFLQRNAKSKSCAQVCGDEAKFEQRGY